MTLNAGINVLVHFYINTLSFLYSLRLAGGGAIAPLAPLNPPLRFQYCYYICKITPVSTDYAILSLWVVLKVASLYFIGPRVWPLFS